MRFEGKIFAFLVPFFLIVCVVYGMWSRDETGIILLIFSAAMVFLAGFYILHTSKQVYPRPEDRDDANIDEGDVDYGFFSPHSWWPLALAGAAAVVVVGLLFAAWIVAFGVLCLLLALIGWVFEYYRGDHAH